MSNVQKLFDPESTSFYRLRDTWEDMLSERVDLTTTDRLIGIWIARRISADGNRRTWYQISTIAERVGVKPRTVMRAIRKLEEEKLIIVRRNGRRGIKKAVNQYELVFPWL